MARGMHKGPRNTRTDQFKSEKPAKKSQADIRSEAWVNNTGASSKTIMHQPGSNKK